MTVDEPREATPVGRASASTSGLRRVYRALGPLGPIVVPAALLLAIMSISRAALCLWYAERLADVPSPLRIFTVGLHIDTVMVSYLAVLPALFMMVAGKRVVLALRFVPTLYWTAAAAMVLFMELATPQFIGEFDLRPNRLFFEYFEHPREVLGTLWAEYWPALVLTIPLVFGFAWAVARLMRRLLIEYRPWRLAVRLALLGPVAALLFLGARGTLGHRAVNISNAAFSDNGLANQLALDSTFSVLYAVYGLRHESDPAHAYGSLPVGTMVGTVRRAAGMTDDGAAVPQSPLRHRQRSSHPRPRPLNLVIVLEESLGAEFVGCLGGLPLTPNIDRLSREGLLLTDFYSTGTRTVRGIEATVTGFLPTPGRSVVKLNLSQNGFFTLAALLGDHGYDTEFIYGGQSNFDDMRSFFQNNGFHRVYDEPTFPPEGFHGTWGVSDDDLFSQADRIFREHGDTPFFALILSTSNHSPFEYPAGTIEPYEQPAATRLNAMKYADHAVGRFFDLARRSDYYDDTLFVILADHNTRTYGNELVPIAKFRIPGLIIGPGVPASTYDRVASQLDIGPTALDLMGLDTEHPMIGRSLVGPEADRPDRAVMQFGNAHAYRIGRRVVIHRPGVPPLQFDYDGERLHPAELDPAFAEEGLAHALLPGWLYRDRLYR